jgi:hypothetical protein
MIMNNPNIPANLKAQVLEQLQQIINNYNGNPQELIAHMQQQGASNQLILTNQDNNSNNQNQTNDYHPSISSTIPGDTVPTAHTTEEDLRKMPKVQQANRLLIRLIH